MRIMVGHFCMGRELRWGRLLPAALLFGGSLGPPVVPHAGAAFAQSALPAFTGYPVPPTRLQTKHTVIIRDERSKRYASVLRQAATRAPDFAGRYILATVGCGASCVMAAAIDGKDGTVVWLPSTVCCWPAGIAEPLEYRPDSRLLIIHGRLGERGRDGAHFYTLDLVKGRFVPLSSRQSGTCREDEP